MKKMRVNKTDLAERVAARAGVENREAYKILNATIEEIQLAVMGGEEIAITDFGVFKPQMRAKRAARNPRTGESKTVPARTVPVFRVAINFRNRVIAARPVKQAPTTTAS